MSNKLEEILRPLLGKTIDLEGESFMLHDILIDEQSLVLLSLDAQRAIQVDQYGDPRRRSPETLILPFHDKDSSETNATIQSIINSGVDLN
jgi:hypothetical protein